jgi:hypothetical protein
MPASGPPSAVAFESTTGNSRAHRRSQGICRADKPTHATGHTTAGLPLQGPCKCCAVARAARRRRGDAEHGTPQLALQLALQVAPQLALQLALQLASAGQRPAAWSRGLTCWSRGAAPGSAPADNFPGRPLRAAPARFRRVPALRSGPGSTAPESCDRGCDRRGDTRAVTHPPGRPAPGRAGGEAVTGYGLQARQEPPRTALASTNRDPHRPVRSCFTFLCAGHRHDLREWSCFPFGSTTYH